jgi:two-component system alkaline phosphatase synthesis response regulator PhoP
MARKILIAEDEPSIVLSLEFLLKEAGHEVLIARDGGEALRLLGSERPDLVVLDVMLPSVNGFEVCRRLRESADTKHIRVLMLTARGRETEVEKGMAAGADAYMTKPFATRELVNTVGRLLEGDPAPSLNA